MDFRQMLIVAAGNNAFVDLKSHLLESVKHIVNAREVIRVIKINIRHDRVVRLIA